MKKLYLLRILSFLICFIVSGNLSAQNYGFEATAANPPTSWTATTGTWVTNTDLNFVRTGAQSMAITSGAAVGGTTIGNTSPTVTVPASGTYYVIAIGWVKSSADNNGGIVVGYRTGSTNTLPTVSSSTAANSTSTSWSRITFTPTAAATNGLTYSPSARAWRNVTSSANIQYLDDIIVYTSTSPTPDVSSPDPATSVIINNHDVSWANSADNGAPASGIGGAVILRADGASLTPPALNDQAMYNPVNGAAGTSTVVVNGITWTVVANINGTATTNFTDAGAASGPYTYAVFMRDMAYNYSPGVVAVPPAACNATPTPGSATINPSTPVCAGAQVTLGLSGNSGGTGQTYQWEFSATQNGSYTPVSGVLNSPSFMINAPSTSMYYRAAVSCNGGNPEKSAAVQVVINPPLESRTYTINSGQATGGTNYATFAEAINAMNCGIAGPVVFEVIAGSGPYNEQVVIPAIQGASAVNRITFNGNNATIQASPVSGVQHIIKLDGADYVTIKDLQIKSQSTSYGWGVHLLNGADFDSIKNCSIDMQTVTSTTQSNSGGIVVAGSATTITTDGSASNNVFMGNTIRGGYQGIIINGTTGALNAVNNKIINNTIQDFYANGIELTDNDGCLISKNDIHRTGRAAVTTFAGVELGSGNKNCVVESNRIHDTHTSATTTTGTAYGVFSNADDAPSGSENKVINNVIYNFNSTGGTGTIYGLYNSGSQGVFYYHNTVVLDYTSSTATGVTRGFYQTTVAANIVIKNNIFYISRGGSGTKYCLYFNTPASGITSNNNVLFMVNGATNGIGFYNSGYATLADWQASNNMMFDQQSVGSNPDFVAAVSGDFTPTSHLVNNVGTPVGVTTDISGTARSTVSPDPGAYEFSTLTAGINMTAEALVTPAVSPAGCYSDREDISIRIRNSSTSIINFANNPVTVTVNVTGTATQTLSVVLNSGTLASDSLMNVTMPAPLDMSVAGVYTFNANVSVQGDVNTGNDAMSQSSRTKQVLNAGTAASNHVSYCVTGGTPTLTAAGITGYSQLQWQQSTLAGSGFTNIQGANTSPFTVPSAITQTMYYRLVATCAGNNATGSAISVALNNPQVGSTTPGARCSPGTVTLGATAAQGLVMNWYTTQTGGTPVATGSPFTTPSISSTTTYYVSAAAGVSSGTVGLSAVSNSPTSGSGTTNFGLVFDAFSAFTLKSVTIYPVSATNAAGTVTIDVINGAGDIVHQAIVNVVGSPTATPSPHVINLNFDIQPGSNYKLRPGNMTGISGLLFEPSASAPAGGNYGYPFTMPGVVTINTSTLGAAPGNAPRNDLYYYFYNWQIATGCEGSRTPVVATINTPGNTTWTGAVSTSWENASNWTCGQVPDETTDVSVPPGAVIKVNSDARVKSLSVGNGANITVNPGFNLTVHH